MYKTIATSLAIVGAVLGAEAVEKDYREGLTVPVANAELSTKKQCIFAAWEQSVTGSIYGTSQSACTNYGELNLTSPGGVGPAMASVESERTPEPYEPL